MVRKKMMAPYRIYIESIDQLDSNNDLTVGPVFKIYQELLNEGDAIHWLDFIGYDKDGWPVYSNDVVELDSIKYKAIYSEEYNGELIWLKVGGEDSLLSDVQLIRLFDLGNAEKCWEDGDYKTNCDIPSFKVVDIVQKHEFKEDYFGQAYDEEVNNVMYFRKCITSENDVSFFEMDVIEFENYHNKTVYGVILPSLPLSPVFVDTSGEQYIDFSLAIEGIESYRNLGNYFLLNENLKNEIDKQLSVHFNIVIENPFNKMNE